jgi:hypothetical protein
MYKTNQYSRPVHPDGFGFALSGVNLVQHFIFQFRWVCVNIACVNIVCFNLRVDVIILVTKKFSIKTSSLVQNLYSFQRSDF